MDIAERTVSDVTVLDLKGKMTLGEGDELLKDKINSLVLQGRNPLGRLDFGEGLVHRLTGLLTERL